MFLLILEYISSSSAVHPGIFTFHNVSINSSHSLHLLTSHTHLHSTMFLLIRLSQQYIKDEINDLHSTMFLLILSIAVCFLPEISTFTFHNVSINSSCPTLPLLVLLPFTFHNVSINSYYIDPGDSDFKKHLHSTMFLLIRLNHL